MDIALYQELCSSRHKLRTPHMEKKEVPRDPGESGLDQARVMCAGLTTIVFVRTPHAISHTSVSYAVETTQSISAKGVERQTASKVLAVRAPMSEDRHTAELITNFSRISSLFTMSRLVMS